MDLVKSIVPLYEIASVDEVYCDVTDMVKADIIKQLGITDSEFENLETLDTCDARFECDWKDTLVVGTNPETTNSLSDLKLMKACAISAKIRSLIFETLGYTCSAGIAHNKTLAKIVSSLNKPNKQTVIRKPAVLDFMAAIKFSKIRGLGGKLGSLVEDKFQTEKASDIWQFSLEELQASIGVEAGTWLYHISRGVCNEPVSPREAKNSIQSFKNFRKRLTLKKDVFEWALCFCYELYDRAQDEYEISKRWPKNIGISIRSENNKITKSCPFPRRGLINSPNDIYEVVEKLLVKDVRVPLSGLGIALSNLQKAPATIDNYFQNFTAKLNSEPVDQPFQVNESKEFLKNFLDHHHDNGFDIPHDIEEPETIPTDLESSKLDELDGSGEPIFYKCLECYKILSRVDRQEHQDHHLALELSRQNPVRIKKEITGSKGTVTKRKRSGTKNTYPTSIQDFFSKKK